MATFRARRHPQRPRGSRGGVALAGALLALSSLTAVIADASPRASGGDDLLIHPYGQWGGWHGSALPYGEEPDGRRILYACDPQEARSPDQARVIGTDLYSDDSDVCFAAIHSGAMTLDQGGPVVIELAGTPAAHVGSTRHGITSQDRDPEDVLPDDRSFVVLEPGSWELPPELLPPGELTVEPTQIDLGSVRVGQQAEATFTVRNTGGGPLTVFDMSLDEHVAGQFQVHADAVTTSPLQPGEHRTVRVGFTPTRVAVGPVDLSSDVATLHDLPSIIIGRPGGGAEIAYFLVRNTGAAGTAATTAVTGIETDQGTRQTGRHESTAAVLGAAVYRIGVRMQLDGFARRTWVEIDVPSDRTYRRQLVPGAGESVVPGWGEISWVTFERQPDAAVLITSDDPAYHVEEGHPRIEAPGAVVELTGTALPAHGPDQPPLEEPPSEVPPDDQPPSVDPPSEEPPEDGPPQDGQPGDQSPVVFDDVAPDSVHAASIGRLVAAGITQGCAADRFCPADPVTRQQMAAFLTRALDLPVPDEPITFADVAADSTHHDAIQALAAAEITLGCGPDRFCPTDPVRRDQMASFLIRALDP